MRLVPTTNPPKSQNSVADERKTWSVVLSRKIVIPDVSALLKFAQNDTVIGPGVITVDVAIRSVVPSAL